MPLPSIANIYLTKHHIVPHKTWKRGEIGDGGMMLCSRLLMMKCSINSGGNLILFILIFLFYNQEENKMIFIICKCGYEVDVEDVEPTVGGFVEPFRVCPRCGCVGLWTLGVGAGHD